MSAVIKTAVVNTRSMMRRIGDFAGDRRGVSAVEFALLLPMMMTLYLGSVEASQGIAANRKVTLATHALADLASHLRAAYSTRARWDDLDATVAKIRKENEAR